LTIACDEGTSARFERQSLKKWVNEKAIVSNRPLRERRDREGTETQKRKKVGKGSKAPAKKRQLVPGPPSRKNLKWGRGGRFHWVKTRKGAKTLPGARRGLASETAISG